MADLFSAITHHNLLAQAAQKINEVDLMNKQLNLLTRQFNLFYQGAAILLTILTVLVSIISSFITWFNTKDVSSKIDKLVDSKVSEEIAEILEVKKADVKAIVETESIIKRTKVAYFLPHSSQDQNIETQEEFKLLEKRGYKITANKDYGNQTPFLNCDVSVLDFINGTLINMANDKNLNQGDREKNNQEILDVVKKVADNMTEKTTLVIYVEGFVKGLDSIFNNHDKYYTPANNLVSLMGRVMDAAQITNAAKGLEK